MMAFKNVSDNVDDSDLESMSHATAPYGSRPSKRRKIDTTSEDSTTSTDEHHVKQKSRRSPTSRIEFSEEDLTEEELEDAKKKSKYKIHVPNQHRIPEKSFQNGTQLSGLPDSSPYRIRGPIWRKPKTSENESLVCLVFCCCVISDLNTFLKLSYIHSYSQD